MVHMRFDKRRTPLVRIWAMMRTGVIKEKPPWYDACRMFPPSTSPGDPSKVPPKLRYLQDTLLENFHNMYQQRFGTAYQGVNHLVGTSDRKRERRTYRDMFVEKQAKLLKRNPSMTHEESFNIIADSEEMQKAFRAERNKLAVMSRWILDPKMERLDASLADIQQQAELRAIQREIKELRIRVKASRERFDFYKKVGGIDEKLEALGK